jgi:sulfur-carrier protein adenylyltransferase/sulfurtransferase
MIAFNEYFSRQMVLPEVGTSGQEKLQAAKCLVIGAGGLGSAALYYLSAAGIGTLGICDSDHLDTTNLHRQILYSIDELGLPKAELAAKRLRKLNPFNTINAYTERLTVLNCEHLLSLYDLILDCTDNFQTKFLINDAAFLFKKPLIRASIYRFEGQLQCFLSERNDACLRCLWPEIPRDECIGNCAETGVLGPLPGFFGTLQAMEALKFFLGLPMQPTNTILIYDLLSHSQQMLTLKRQTSCPLCGTDPEIRELSLKDTCEIEPSACMSAEFQLVDIREQAEVSADPLIAFQCLHMPLSTFNEKSLSHDKKYLFCCQRGRRSLNLVTHLRSLGWKNVFSLSGGALALKNNPICQKIS